MTTLPRRQPHTRRLHHDPASYPNPNLTANPNPSSNPNPGPEADLEDLIESLGHCNRLTYLDLSANELGTSLHDSFNPRTKPNPNPHPHSHPHPRPRSHLTCMARGFLRNLFSGCFADVHPPQEGKLLAQNACGALILTLILHW